MQIGIIGLGRVGADMTRRLLRGQHECIVYCVGSIPCSGEGRWTVDAAIDEGVPAPVISAALHARLTSRGHDEFADKLLSAMRYAFGGHVENTSES